MAEKVIVTQYTCGYQKRARKFIMRRGFAAIKKLTLKEYNARL